MSKGKIIIIKHEALTTIVIEKKKSTKERDTCEKHGNLP
jgi:Ribonuclease G/E